MNFTPEQVELIVQRVLEHFEAPAAAAPGAAGSPVALTKASAEPRTARIPEPVVTQALLADAAAGSKRVAIAPRAILTPAARDFVRQQGIEIVREPAAAQGSVAERWQILVTTPAPQIASASESLRRLGIAVEHKLLGLPAEAAAQGTSALCRGEADKVVVVSDQPELVACLANRNDRIRAAAASATAAVERIQRHLKANLLAIDPGGRGSIEIGALLKAFTAG